MFASFLANVLPCVLKLFINPRRCSQNRLTKMEPHGSNNLCSVPMRDPMKNLTEDFPANINA